MPGPMTGHCRIWRKSRTGNRLMMRDVPRGRRGLSLALGGDRQGLFLGKVIDDRVERGIAYRGQGRVITPRGKRRRCLEGEGSFQCHDAATARRGALLIDQGEAVALVERQCRAVGEDSQAQRARAGLSARESSEARSFISDWPYSCCVASWINQFRQAEPTPRPCQCGTSCRSRRYRMSGRALRLMKPTHSPLIRIA